MSQVVTNFKRPKAPKVKEPNAASKRPGMDPHHLANIRKLSSCLSGDWPCDPHHLRCAGGRGVGQKAEDKWAVPITREEHIKVHSMGGKREFDWFRARGINPLELATALWANRGDVAKMQAVVNAHRGSRHE